MSDKTIMVTIKARLGSAREAELKELYADVRNQAGEEMAKIDAYIDARMREHGGAASPGLQGKHGTPTC